MSRTAIVTAILFTAAGAAPTGTACAALAVVSERDLQNRRQDHESNQTGRSDDEKMAFEHATQSPRRQAVPLNGSRSLRK